MRSARVLPISSMVFLTRIIVSCVLLGETGMNYLRVFVSELTLDDVVVNGMTMPDMLIHDKAGNFRGHLAVGNLVLVG